MSQKKQLQTVPRMNVTQVDSLTAYKVTSLPAGIDSSYFYRKYTKEESETAGQGGTAVSSKKPLMSSGFSPDGCVAALIVNIDTNSAFLVHIDDYSQVFCYLPNDLAYAHFCKEPGKKIGFLIAAQNSSKMILKNRKEMLDTFKQKEIEFLPDLTFGPVKSHWALLYEPIIRELSIHRRTEQELLQYQLFPPLGRILENEPIEETVAKEQEKLCRVRQLTNKLLASLQKRDLAAMQQLFREPLAKQVCLIDYKTHLLTSLSTCETYTYDFVDTKTSQQFYDIIKCCADNLSRTNQRNRDCCLKAYRALMQTIKPHISIKPLKKLFNCCRMQVISLQK